MSMTGYKLLMRGTRGFLMSGITNVGAKVTFWKPGEVVKVPEDEYRSRALCGSGWLHFYDSVAQAKIMDIHHAGYMRTCAYGKLTGSRYDYDEDDVSSVEAFQELTGDTPERVELWMVRVLPKVYDGMDTAVLMSGTKMGAQALVLEQCVDQDCKQDMSDEFLLAFWYNMLHTRMGFAQEREIRDELLKRFPGLRLRTPTCMASDLPTAGVWENLLEELDYTLKNKRVLSKVAQWMESALHARSGRYLFQENWDYTEKGEP